MCSCRWLDRMHKQKLRTFVRKATRPMDPEEVVNREWLQIDRIVTERFVAFSRSFTHEPR